MAYVLGRREFWGRAFEVTRAVLVPRPETELLVEQALARLDPDDNLTVLDAGTGSGCIAVTLALERPRVRCIATDISAAALQVARRNAARYAVSRQIAFQRDHLLGNAGSGWVDMIVSNPPYVPARETLQPEVRDYEPSTALFGGKDGLDVIRQLVEGAVTYLPGGAWLLFEFGWGQVDEVRALLRGSGKWRAIETVPDLQGIPRVAIAQRGD